MHSLAHCHIFAAGSLFGLYTAPQPDDLIIAADGGLHHCLACGLVPDLLLGDFDSVGTLPTDIPLLRYPTEKDDTDTMLALKEGLARGYRLFHLHACAGGRLDHTFGNLQALAFAASHGALAFLYAETEICAAIDCAGLAFSPRDCGYFSIFCIGSDTHVSIQGAAYSHADILMQAGIALGVSNRFIGAPMQVEAKDGCVLLTWPKDGPLPHLITHSD